MTPDKEISLVEHFKQVKDPRRFGIEHLLIDIITIAICSVICGADGWVAVEQFGRAKESWFRKFLQLPNGIPSHDTFGRVFRMIDPHEFQSSFVSWVEAIREFSEGELVALDGKRLRRSHNGRLGKGAIHMVSAWAATNGLVLGQVKTEEKSNEITAIPQLLERLALQGCIVTIDAMGCQTEIARLIIEQEADYVLALKGNQGTLHQDVQELFASAQEVEFQEVSHEFHQTVDKGHGRIEVRRHWIIDEPEFIDFVNPKQKWSGLQAIGMVESHRTIAGQTSTEVRYYIASLAADAAQFAGAVRTHWEIENKVHWLSISKYQKLSEEFSNSYGVCR